MTIEEVKALIENKKYLDYIKSDEDMPLLLKLLEANCNNEEIKFVLDNTDIFKWTADADYPIKRELIQICMNIGAKAIRSCAGGLSCELCSDRMCNICGDYMYTRQIIEQYNYAESVFKNKPKCFAFSALDHSAEYLRIPNDLVVYFDNFDDDSLYKVLKRVWTYGNAFIIFALKLSTLTTNVNEIFSLYNKLFRDGETDRFAEDTYKKLTAGAITADVIIKFCKMKKIDIPDFVKDALPEYIESIDDTIERLVDYFESSKRFALKYDDETIYIIAVLRNNAPRSSHMVVMEDDSIRKGCRIITFHKEDDDNYEYIFKIDHEDDERLTYSAKITTEKDVVDCINKSIALIEGIDEYSVIVEELQELLEYLTT